MPGTLFIVGTPIGNLEDMTFRAVRVLNEVDLIAAEDTRVTAKLLAHFQIQTHSISFHRYSSAGREQQVIQMLLEDKNVALVSDAGMPGISDPGQSLIVACLAQGIAVTPIPGPSSLTTALAVSGFNTDRFIFHGFLPRANKNRLELFQQSLAQLITNAAFEAPHRITDSLAALAKVAPEQPVLVAREITKKFEELLRGTALELSIQAASKEIRGEIVMVWPGGVENNNNTPPPSTIENAIIRAQQYQQAGMSAKDASSFAANETGVAKREIYQALIKQANLK